MPIQPIVRLGHPALRIPAEPVDLGRLADPQLQALIDDMFETMLNAGAVGLAAPQLGIGLQLFVYAVVVPQADTDAAAGEVDLRALVNPTLGPITGEMVYDWEG